MSKTDLISNVATKENISKAEAKRLVETVLGEIENGLKSLRKTPDETYNIGNFGTFYITTRKARTGINPRTQEPIEIKASKNLRFRPYAQLKRSAGC
ncbi:MAG: HU family DNA-binding protein [Hyphomicrobiales bacterium]|nr:HU family DNA-binding protein [Hyphomicrobiales bacterium]MCY4049169.1 HU family DNA-binding protein [Hyphomicrobiales bacterium]MCY4052896.1 HU family DNA-binding protein [Hyphomicrobiales bacterium]